MNSTFRIHPKGDCKSPLLMLPLLEYALGGDTANPVGRPAPVLAGDRFSFRHLPDRTDAEQIVETSTDLVNWTPVATIRAAGLSNDVASGFTLESDGATPETLSISPAPPPGGPAPSSDSRSWRQRDSTCRR